MNLSKLSLRALTVCGALALSCSSTFASKLWFQPQSPEAIENCPTSVDVYLDTEGQETTAMDLRVLEDKSFTFNDFNGQGGLFRSYSTPRITESGKQKSMYVIASTVSRQGINGSGKLGTLTVTPLANSTQLSLKFAMVPWADADDSNVPVFSGSGTPVDSLKEAQNITIPVKKGSCTTASQQALTTENTQAVTVEENTQFKSQRPWDERKDAIGARLAINFRYRFGGLIVVALIGIGVTMTNKGKAKK